MEKLLDALIKALKHYYADTVNVSVLFFHDTDAGAQIITYDKTTYKEKIVQMSDRTNTYYEALQSVAQRWLDNTVADKTPLDVLREQLNNKNDE